MTDIENPSRTRDIAVFMTRAAVSMLLVSVLVSRVDWGSFSHAIRQTSLIELLLALAVFWLAVMLRSVSYALVVNRSRRLISSSDSLALTLIGSAASLVMPSGTGELVKAHFACRTHGKPEYLVPATMIDKLTSLPALAVVAAPSAFASGLHLVGALAILLGIVALIPIIKPSVVPWRLAIRAVGSMQADVTPRMIAEATHVRPSRLVGVVAISVLGWLVSFAAIHTVAHSLGSDIPIAHTIMSGAIMTLANLLPISLAGLGLSQFTLVAVLVGLGVDDQAATQIAIVHLGMVLTPALVGAALILTRASPVADGRMNRAYNGEPLSVALVTTVFPRNSGDFTGRIVHQLAIHLVRKSVNVSVHAPHAPGLPVVEEMDGVEVNRFRYLPQRWERLAYSETGIPGALRRAPALWLTAPFFVAGLARAARRAARDSDILHAQWAPTGLVCSVAAPRIRTALTMRGSDISLAHKSVFWRMVTLAALRRCEPLICVSEAIAHDVRSLPGAPPMCIHVVHDGIDAAVFDSLKRPSPEPRLLPHVLFVGRMTVEKGASDLLVALADPRVRPVSLTMVGDCGIEERAQQAAALGLARRTVFTGRLPHSDVLALMRTSDIVVVPSHAEGFSLVALEASAVGSPVIGAAVGAIPEFVHPEALFAPGDIDALAMRVESLLSDPKLAKEVSAYGIRQAARFTWENTLEPLISAYAHDCDHR
ncbi:MAG: flippase-like domain-containing protein [Clostridiales bacterium]|nr:flippase-like domain-containing protein [Clostridiales bacterium]